MNIRGLETQYMGQTLEYYEEIDSTNIRAKEWAKVNAIEGSLVIANYQSAGKGRLGRNWVSPKGTGIWMSIVLKPLLPIDKIPQLTLIAGLCMCKAIQEATGLETKIKWPNDIVVNNKKVCGILTEMSANKSNTNYVVVGVGVNVNNLEIDKSIPHATSLALESNVVYEREQIIKIFLEVFEKYYEQYKEIMSLEFLIEEYKTNCVNLNKEVKILKNDEEVIAYAEDINTEGSLIIRKEDEQYETIFTGEVSVRGLYGYV